MCVGGIRMSVIDDVDLVAGDLAQQPVGVLALGDDLEVVVLEQADEALAQQDAVLGDRYPHGISALTRVPPPLGVQTRSRPPSASTRSASPRRPVPFSVSAPPTPSSVISTTSSPFGARDERPGRGRLRVLADVGEALVDDVVGGDLDRLLEALVDLDLEVDRDREVAGERLERDRRARGR